MGTDLPTSSDVGQVTDPSTPSATATVAQVRNDLSELVRVIELSTKAFTRTSAVLVKMSERLDTIEAKLDARSAAPASDDEEAIEPGPVTERRAIGPVPRLALRSDGITLLEVTNDVHEDDLKDRTVGRYVELTEAEASDALTCAEEGFSTGAAKVVWLLARGRKGYPKADEAPTEPTL